VVSVLTTYAPLDLLGQLADRRERLAEQLVKELVKRHPAHKSGQPQAPVNALADARGQPHVTRRRRAGCRCR
jgi:hypothetical protein